MGRRNEAWEPLPLGAGVEAWEMRHGSLSTAAASGPPAYDGTLVGVHVQWSCVHVWAYEKGL